MSVPNAGGGAVSQFQCFSDADWVCRCGAATCRGSLGATRRDVSERELMSISHEERQRLLQQQQRARNGDDSVFWADGRGESLRPPPVPLLSTFCNALVRARSACARSRALSLRAARDTHARGCAPPPVSACPPPQVCDDELARARESRVFIVSRAGLVPTAAGAPRSWHARAWAATADRVGTEGGAVPNPARNCLMLEGGVVLSGALAPGQVPYAPLDEPPAGGGAGEDGEDAGAPAARPASCRKRRPSERLVESIAAAAEAPGAGRGRGDAQLAAIAHVVQAGGGWRSGVSRIGRAGPAAPDAAGAAGLVQARRKRFAGARGSCSSNCGGAAPRVRVLLA